MFVYIHHTHTHTQVLLCYLSLETIISVVSALLLERRVVVECSDPLILSAIAMALPQALVCVCVCVCVNSLSLTLSLSVCVCRPPHSLGPRHGLAPST